MIACPSPTDLQRAFAALLGGREDPAVVDHVEVCRACQTRLETWLDGSPSRPRLEGRPEASIDSHSSAQDQTGDGVGPSLGAAVGPHDLLAPLPEVPGYEILGRLGHGGMGVVYKARHLGLGRLVALKMILAGEHADPDRLARFHLEAEAVAHLRHPNIVAIHDIGTANGMPYIALEYLPGGSLERLLQQGPQPARASAELLAGLAQAVHTAHLAGIVHRDLKPANVLLAEDGAAKVTDFGLAKRLEAPGQTQTGQIIGTPAYMAPEQARGESKGVGPAADVYALGALLYEMLTGKAPFRGETAMQTLQMVLADEPTPPRKLVPGVPADLETVCLKALRKEPGERYPTAQEFADELNRFLHDEPVRARPLRRAERVYRWCRRNPMPAALLAATAGLLLMAVVASTLGVYHVRLVGALAGKEEQRVRAEDALRKVERYLYFNDVHMADRFYHEDQFARAQELLNHCAPEQRGWEWRYLDRIMHAELLRLAGHTQSVHALAFPPHGGWLVSGSSDRRLAFWNQGIGPGLTRLAGHSGPVWGVAVSPDGQRLASVAGSAREAGEVIVWDLETGPDPRPREALRVQDRVGERAAVAYHPTRPVLAVAAGFVAGRSGTLLLLDSGGKEVRRWEAGAGCVALAWSPDGSRLAASFLPAGPSDSLGEVLVLDPAKAEPSRQFSASGGEALALAFSPDGRTLAVGGGNRLIELFDADTLVRRESLRGHTGPVTSLAFTPDGRLVSGSRDTTVRAWDIHRGQELFQRRGHYGPVRCVAVDPGTGRIYSGSEDMDVKVWRPENSQESDAYPLHRGAATGVAFNPEDDSLVSVGLDGAVWWIDPTGREPPRQLRQEPHPLRQVRFLPGTQTVLVAGGGEEPTRNDGTVRFLDARDGRLAGELTTRLAMVSSLSVSLDGRRLVVVGRPREGDTVAQVWDLTSRRLEYAIPAPTAVAAQLYPDGNRLIVLLAQPLDSLNPSFALFDLADGPRPIHSARRFAVAAPYFAVFGTDESFMIMGGQDQCLTLCQINPGGSLTNLSTYRGHAGAIHNGALSPDQRLFATASADETIRVWDRETTRELLALRGDAGPMIDVAFSRTGNFLAAAQGSGTVRVWDGRPRPGPGGQPASPPGR